MAKRKVIDQRGFDWITFAIYISLVIVGAISLYSVLYTKGDSNSILSLSTPFGKYSIIILTSLILFLISYVIDWKFWSTFAFPIYIISIIFLILVLIFGTEIKGSRSWFSLFGFSFQPSEFAKFGAALGISSFLAHYKNSFRNLKSTFQAAGIVVLPMFLILLQPDAGSAIIFTSLLFLFYRAGFTPLFYIISGILAATFIITLVYNPQIVSLGALLLSGIIFIFVYTKNKYFYLIILAIIILSIYTFIEYSQLITIGVLSLIIIIVSFFHWLKNRENGVVITPMTAITIVMLAFVTNYSFFNILKPHQQDRINVWLNPEKSDPRGSLYNVLQSKTAIGSGGIEGKGFLEGAMTHLNFVPEQTTDFIFSSIGEEQGFIGVVSIILLFLLLFMRLIVIAERGKNKFTTYFAYALTGYLFVHFALNIGMNMGLVPVVGIPLPFISKGGSSLLIFSMMLGALLKMDSERNVR